MSTATTWRLAFLAIQGGSSVLLFAVLAHLLPERALAATAVAQGVIVIAQSVGDFGLSQAAVTVLPARIAAGRGTAADLLSGAAAASLGATGLAVVLTLLAVPLVPDAAAGPVAISGLAAAACVAVAGADGILRSQGEFRRPVVLMATSELAGFLGIPVAAATSSAFWTCVAIAGGMAMGAVWSAVVLVRLRRAAPDAPVRPFARASVPLGISQVFNALATRADTLIAGSVAGLVAAGTFEGCWRVYQLGQYVAGGVASALAPFIAHRLGAARTKEGLGLIKRLALLLFGLGLAAGIVLYLLRTPIADVLAGALGRKVARSLPALALVSPIQAVSLVAYYTLIGRDGQRRAVLGAIAAGAAVNIALAFALGPSHGARGVVIACAAGQGTTALLLLTRLWPLVKRLGASSGEPALAPDLPPEVGGPAR